MAAAEAVVQVDQRHGHGPDRLDVRIPHPRAGVPRDRRVRARDQPVPAGLDQRGRRDRRAGQEVAAPHVAAPQLADLLDRADDGRGELEADARREVLAVGHPRLVDGDRTVQLPAQRLGDDAGRPAARLLPAQPPCHRCLVVAQVEAALGSDHVDPPGEPGVGAPGFLDECLEPFVRLARDERPGCQWIPPVAAVISSLITARQKCRECAAWAESAIFRGTS